MRRPLASWAVGVVAALALTSCTSSTDDEPTADPTPTASPTPPPPAEPAPPAPAAGACYRLSYDEALAPTSSDAVIDCGKGHTSQTYAVGELDLVADGHLLAVDSDTVRQQVANRCPRQLAAYLGASEPQLRLSLLRPVWFTPTIEESDLGAAWFRCDVVAITGEGTVAKFTGDLAGSFGRPAGRAAYAMCGTDQPGTASFSRVLCRDEHSWRAITVVDLAESAKKGGAYPGEKSVRAAGQTVCLDAARAIASDALDYEWGYEWPTAEQWAAGQTYGRCWSPDPA